jgi:hypothetical protein
MPLVEAAFLFQKSRRESCPQVAATAAGTPGLGSLSGVKSAGPGRKKKGIKQLLPMPNPLFLLLVPKPGFEPGQAYTH